MQPSLSLTTKEMCRVACIAAGCGALYLLRCWVNNIAQQNTEELKREATKQRTKPEKPFIAQLRGEKKEDPQKREEERKQNLTPEDIKKITENRKARQQKKNDGVRELHQACLDNDVQKVNKLLEDCCMHINEIALIRRKFNNSDNSCYYQTAATPLHIAINIKNNAIIDLLLTHKDIDFSIVDSKGNTPLCYACQQNDSNTVKKLLVHNNMKFTDAGALLIACTCGHKEIVTLLLAYNKDHNNC